MGVNRPRKKKSKKKGFVAPFNLGGTTLIKELSGVPSGLARVALNPRQGVPALAKGVLSSLASTSATLFEPLGEYNPVELWGDRFLGKDEVQDFWERSKNRGLLPALFEDVGNVAAVGSVGKLGLARRISKAEAAGDAAQAAKLGQRLKTLTAVSQPYRTAFRQGIDPASRAASLRIQRATKAAAEAGIKLPAEAVPGADILSDADTVIPKRRGKAASAPSAGPLDADRSLIPALMKQQAGAPAATRRRLDSAIAAAQERIRQGEAPIATPLIPETVRAYMKETAAGPKLPEGVSPNTGPLEESVLARRSVAPSEKMQALIDKAPEPIVKALASVDRRVLQGELKAILREQEIFAESARSAAVSALADHTAAARTLIDLSEAEVKAGVAGAKKISPDVADKMVGDYVRSAITEEAGLLRHIQEGLPDALSPEMLKARGIRGTMIPERFISDATSPLAVTLNRAVDATRAMNQERLAVNVGSVKGAKGLERVGMDTPDLTPAGKKGVAAAGKLTQDVQELVQKIPAERLARAVEYQKLVDTVSDLDSEIANLKSAAKAPSLASAKRPPKRTRIQIEGRRDAAMQKVGRKLEIRKQVNLSLHKLLAEMTAGDVPSAIKAKALSARAERLYTAAERSLLRPSMARVPAHMKGIWHDLLELADEAESTGNAALAEAVAGFGDTFPKVMSRARELGFNPEHMSKFTTEQVQRAVFQEARLFRGARGVAQETTSGVRKTSRYTHPETIDRSIASLATAMVESTVEAQTGQYVQTFEKLAGVPIEAFGGVIPPGWESWSPVRNWILTGENIVSDSPALQGAKLPGTAEMVIPKNVGDAIRRSARNYNHPAFDYLRRATSPWRFMILFMRPAFYVNNAVGAGMLATVAGVKPQDWARAWRANRGFAATAGKRVRAGAAFDVTTLGTTPEDVALYAKAMTHGLIATATGIEPHTVSRGGRKAIGDALSESTAKKSRVRDAFQQVQLSLGRISATTDDIARAATMFAGIRKGASAEHALQTAMKALLDYGSLGPLERSVVRSAAPFYAFQREILKNVAKTPLRFPEYTGLMLTLGQLNQDLAEDHYGVTLPRAYKDVVNIPGLGDLNLRGLVPFADADTLTTPQGIAQSLTPPVEILLRNALGAPEGGYVDDWRMGDFGRVEPSTNIVSDVLDVGKYLPQTRLATSQDKGNQALRYLGLPRVSRSQMDKVIARVKAAQKDRRLNP